MGNVEKKGEGNNARTSVKSAVSGLEERPVSAGRQEPRQTHIPLYLSEALASSVVGANGGDVSGVDLYKEALRILSQALTEGKIDLFAGESRLLSTSEVIGVAKLFLKSPTPQAVNVNLFGDGPGE